MKRALIAAAVLSCATHVDAATCATISIKDGSTLNAEFRTERITCSAAFAKELPLDPAIVKSIAFAGTNGEAKVELNNGDRFTVAISDKSFAFSSILGDLDIALSNIISMKLCEKPRLEYNGLVFHCTFDDEASITSPAIGPSGKFLQGQFQEGKLGQALQTTVYAQNATFELPANFFSTAGCIEFWAKILNTSSHIGTGGDPRLFTLTPTSSPDTISTIDIVSNDGGGNSGFATYTLLGNLASVSGLRNLRYEDLFPGSNPRDWHHYAVLWDKNGISDLPGTPRMALLVDGRLMPVVRTVIRSDKDVTAVISKPALLCFTHDPARDPELATKSPFLIDEFKIWNYARTTFDQ